MPMHMPVMLDETLTWLAPETAERIVDATLGGGGHAEGILSRMPPTGRLLGLDADPEAVARCRQRLAAFGSRFIGLHRRFSELPAVLRELGWDLVDGVLMDLGVSSFQLEAAERGFSFAQDGPLDMRMDPTAPGPRAADLVNTMRVRELETLLRRYGEEPRARRIAQAIARRREQRPFETTADLAAVICAAVGGRRGAARHPATRAFMALRIAVNRELEELERGLAAAWSALRSGGRLVVISFHSLEDRIVKQFIRSRTRGTPPLGRDRTPHVIRPTEVECRANPRARSARLRAVEKGEASTKDRDE